MVGIIKKSESRTDNHNKDIGCNEDDGSEDNDDNGLQYYYSSSVFGTSERTQTKVTVRSIPLNAILAVLEDNSSDGDGVLF